MIKIIYFCLLVSASTAIGVENRGSSLTRLANSQYYISPDAVTFAQAWAYCENYGMKFISLSDASETSKVLQSLDNIGVAKPNNFWVGGIYLQSGLVNKWYWVNGESFVYNNWYTSLKVTGDNCIRFDYTAVATTNGKWTPVSCVNKYKFICKN